MDFDYKKYSLENLEKWMSDALLSSEATPQEIYDVIRKVVEEEYYYFKHHTGRCYELLALLNGNGNSIIEGVKAHRELSDKEDKITSCNKDDLSPECQKSWTSFWEEHYYPEEHKKPKVEDVMPPWGHSDMEALGYTEEELNAMCEKAALDQKKDECREYNLREAEYYDKRAKLDVEQTNKKNWVIPIEVDGASGEYYIQFPDDLMEAANIKENDMVEWVDRGDGSYMLKKVNNSPSWVEGNKLTKTKTYDEMIADGWSMTADGFWIKEHLEMDEC